MVHIIIRGKGRSGDIPDPAYREEAQKRELRSQGWDFDRAVRHIRKNVREDKEGRKSVQM